MQDMAKAEFSASLIEVVCADVLEIDWSSCDVVYAASTCMSPTLLRGILERAKMLRTGSVLITLQEASQLFSQGDNTNGWFLHKACGPFHFSWGLATAHVLIKQDAATHCDSPRS